MSEEYRKEILVSALEGRDRECVEYEVNIRNFEMALSDIASMSPSDQAGMKEFADRITELLASSRAELGKASLMRSVVRRHLEEVGG